MAELRHAGGETLEGWLFKKGRLGLTKKKKYVRLESQMLQIATDAVSRLPVTTRTNCTYICVFIAWTLAAVVGNGVLEVKFCVYKTPASWQCADASNPLFTSFSVHRKLNHQST